MVIAEHIKLNPLYTCQRLFKSSNNNTAKHKRLIMISGSLINFRKIVFEKLLMEYTKNDSSKPNIPKKNTIIFTVEFNIKLFIHRRSKKSNVHRCEYITIVGILVSGFTILKLNDAEFTTNGGAFLFILISSDVSIVFFSGPQQYNRRQKYRRVSNNVRKIYLKCRSMLETKTPNACVK